MRNRYPADSKETIMLRHHVIRLMTLLFVALAMTGCFTKKAPPPTELSAKFLTSEYLNPNADGVPSPIVVRLYELKSTARFNNTDFFSLFDNDVTVLGSDLLNKDGFSFNPDESKTIHRILDPATRFIAVMAAYRDLETSTWRATSVISEHKLNTFTIHLDNNKLSILTGSSDTDKKTHAK